MRLVTRPDFDGLVCGSIITAMEKIDGYLFVEPKFMQDGMVDIRAGDIIANLPYNPNCTLWFDHHFTNVPAWASHAGVSSSESGLSTEGSRNLKPETRNPTVIPGKGAFRLAPSAARNAISRPRAAARVKSRFAMFAQVISRSKATAARSVNSAPLTSATTCCCSRAAMMPLPLF